MEENATPSELLRTPWGTYVFEWQGMSIHDPLSSDCGRFRYAPGESSFDPSQYGFAVARLQDGTSAWERQFHLDGGLVTMRVTDATGRTHEVSAGAAIRIAVSRPDGSVLAAWMQDEGPLDCCPPRLLPDH